MIPVFADQESIKARQLLSDLHKAGIAAQLVEDLPQMQDLEQEFALVHVSRLALLNRKRAMTCGAAPVEPIARSEAMRRVLELSTRVAATDISVLISGESGTGKEVLCRAIHAASPRSEGPFVAVNCAAIPESMVEAELFGHEKGAFTGASDKRRGKFELAHGGTLLLDEITEMPLEPQAKLLRVLQEREVERLGSHRPMKVDVRVLATSNRDLKQAVADGVLREDLYYRLSVFPINLPPLRERVQDILPLAEHLLAKHAGGMDVCFSAQALQALCAHSWPGNVRELENTVQRALVMCTDGQIQTADLGLQHSPEAPGGGQVSTDSTLREQLQSQQDQLLLEKLNNNGGSRKQTAAQLGISERTLRHKLKQMRERGALE